MKVLILYHVLSRRPRPACSPPGSQVCAEMLMPFDMHAKLEAGWERGFFVKASGACLRRGQRRPTAEVSVFHLAPVDMCAGSRVFVDACLHSFVSFS
jgi:hypothetical protein